MARIYLDEQQRVVLEGFWLDRRALGGELFVEGPLEVVFRSCRIEGLPIYGDAGRPLAERRGVLAEEVDSIVRGERAPYGPGLILEKGRIS